MTIIETTKQVLRKGHLLRHHTSVNIVSSHFLLPFFTLITANFSVTLPDPWIHKQQKKRGKEIFLLVTRTTTDVMILGQLIFSAYKIRNTITSRSEVQIPRECHFIITHILSISNAGLFWSILSRKFMKISLHIKLMLSHLYNSLSLHGNVLLYFLSLPLFPSTYLTCT